MRAFSKGYNIPAVLILLSGLLLLVILYLEKNPIKTVSITKDMVKKTITSPSERAKVTYTTEGYTRPLVMYIEDVPFAANIPNYKPLYSTYLEANYIEEPQKFLKTDMEITFNIVETAKHYDKTTQKWWEYQIQSPAIFFLDKENGWMKVEDIIEQNSNQIIIKTNKLGSYTVAFPSDVPKKEVFE